MSKLLIINGSPRKNGVCAIVAEKATESAKKFNYTPETVDLQDLEIHGCRACMSCKKTGKCAQNDGMSTMYDRIRSSDAMILIAPIYFGAESAQMKAFIDRFYAMIGTVDGKRVVDIGNVKKMSVALVCGAPDGHLVYGGVLGRFAKTVKSLGVTDYSGYIINGVSPDEARGSAKVQEYIDNLEFQLEM